MTRIYAEQRVRRIALAALVGMVFALMLVCCGEETPPPPPDETPKAEQVAQPAPEPVVEKPAVEEGLTQEEQQNLAQSLKTEAAEEITAENAEAMADALEKEIAADLQ